MRSTSFIAATLCALSATVYSAPTSQPGLSNIVGSITNPGAGNDNVFKGNLNGNGNKNGNSNEAGNQNGNHNVAGNGNSAGNGNTVALLGLKSILKNRGMLKPIQGITNTIGSVTNPTAGSGNKFLGNLNGNGNGNGNGNSAGNDNGNGNSAGNGNKAFNGNTVTVSPNTALPDVALPDVNLSPTINLARSD